MCLSGELTDAGEIELQWNEVRPYGPISVPGGSRWELGELVSEVDEYFEMGASLERGAVVFDVGANVGVFSLAAAQRCEGDVELFCFEPAPPIFGALAANAERNELLSRATPKLFPVALGARPEASGVKLSYFRELPTDSTIDIGGKRRDFELFFAHHGNKLRATAAPFVSDAVARPLGAVVAKLPTGAFGRRLSDLVTGRVEYDCTLTTLSTVVKLYDVRRIDLLKIDVEGAELEVLKGIEDRHWPRIRQIVLEGHDQNGQLRAIERLLARRGLEVVRVDRPSAAEDRGLSTFLLYARRVEGERAVGAASFFGALGLELMRSVVRRFT